MVQDNLPLVLTPGDVCKLLGISKNKTYEVFHSQGFPAFRAGKQLRVRQEKFWEWIEHSEKVG